MSLASNDLRSSADSRCTRNTRRVRRPHVALTSTDFVLCGHKRQMNSRHVLLLLVACSVPVWSQSELFIAFHANNNRVECFLSVLFCQAHLLFIQDKRSIHLSYCLIFWPLYIFRHEYESKIICWLPCKRCMVVPTLGLAALDVFRRRASVDMVWIFCHEVSCVHHGCVWPMIGADLCFAWIISSIVPTKICSVQLEADLRMMYTQHFLTNTDEYNRYF